MNFFNLCCHSKSKKSLEYINDWIDAHSLAFNSLSTAVTSLQTWKDTLNNDIVKIVEDIANTYDYVSAIPQLTTMSNDIKDLQSGLNSLDVLVSNKLFNFSSTLNTLQKSMSNKVDAVIPATINSIALLDSTGNLVDSGKTLKDILVRPDAIVNNTYGISIDSDGEASINVTGIILGGDFSVEGDLEIYPEHVPNIRRAIQTPDLVPTYNSDKLITSSAVYKGLLDKADVNHTHYAALIVGNFPKYIQYFGTPIDLDVLFSDINLSDELQGSIKVCVRNYTEGPVLVSDILYSELMIPRHLNTVVSDSEREVPSNGYIIFNIYKVLKANLTDQPEHADEHGGELCYFIIIEGIFDETSY